MIIRRADCCRRTSEMSRIVDQGATRRATHLLLTTWAHTSHQRLHMVGPHATLRCQATAAPQDAPKKARQQKQRKQPRKQPPPPPTPDPAPTNNAHHKFGAPMRHTRRLPVTAVVVQSPPPATTTPCTRLCGNHWVSQRW